MKKLKKVLRGGHEMEDMKISLSVPATIYSFGETESLTKNQYVTHAKLKVFYVGQTGDKRVFTKQFSDQLLQTLPGTPVVAYYDAEKDDFIGHNYVQYVFGYVPEAATITYMNDIVDGKAVQFAVTDVLLFTGRPDLIGMVSNKIIGKAHSLELDPATVEYTIVKTKMGIDSITFNKGHFIGLSVLGDDEKPAFSGSSFFNESATEDVKVFIQSFEEFKKEVELYKSGGQLMNEENNLPILESEQEVTQASTEEVEVIVAETETTVTEATEVEEIPTVATEAVEDEKPEEEVKEEEPEEMTELTPEAPIVEEIVSSEVVVEAETLEGMEDDREQKQKEDQVAQTADASALNDAERQELNEYRKKAKFELIQTYSDLEESVKSKYLSNHANYTVEELDKELAYELVKTQRQITKKNGVKVFSMISNVSEPKTVADYINEYKDKK
jgi:hypothetical protein